MYVVSADGSTLTRLTQGKLDHFPQWSPDGRQIAFSRNGNIWVMNFSAEPTPQVSDLRQLTTDPKEYASSPVWSPDGKQIAFASQVGDAHGVSAYNDPNTAEIFVMNADGANLHKLTDNQTIDITPGWSPDGKQIAFSSNRDGAFQVYVMDADGSNVRQLTTGDANNVGSAWSPDGTRIAFASDRDGQKYVYDIYLMDADGSHQTRLTTSPWDESSPVWKPAANASALSAGLAIEVPTGNPPTLDGVLSPGEWFSATQQEFTDGGDLYLMQNGGYLYLGIHENIEGLTTTSVFIEYDDKISVKHSSGSLGTAIFTHSNDGWLLIQSFQWSLYGVTSNTEADQQQREAFLEGNGWLANLGSMTAIQEIEYQIAMPDGPFRVAVAYLKPSNSDKAAWWPANLADDCRKIELLQANIPVNLDTPYLLQFAPETWATITPTSELAAYAFPVSIDLSQKYLFYFHGKIIEDQGIHAVSPDFGEYEYDAILEKLSGYGFVVISEQRSINADGMKYAERVVGQVAELLKAGVPAKNITVIGASKGAGIATSISYLLK